MKTACSCVFNLVFPDQCRVCDRPLGGLSRVPVCSSCLEMVSPLSTDYFCVMCRTPFATAFPLDEYGRCALCRNGLQGFDAAYCYGAYDGVLRRLIHLFKYERIRSLVGPLSSYMAAALPRDQRFDLIVPVPLHWRRRWERGFNQSALLAEALSRRSGIPLHNALRRRKATAPQAGLPASGRRSNVAGAFVPARRCQVRNRRVLLVDDVMTTGATIRACARTLKAAGAAYVAVLTIARADRRQAPALPAGNREAAAC